MVNEIVALAESFAVLATMAMVCALATMGGATYVAEDAALVAPAAAPGAVGVTKFPTVGSKLQVTRAGLPAASVASKVTAWPDVNKTV